MLAGIRLLDWAALRLPMLVLMLLLVLTALGWGGYVAVDRYLTERRVAARMGPLEKLVSLPQMEFGLGGNRKLDLKVSLVLKRNASLEINPSHRSRINARLYEALQDIGADGLSGADGPASIKQTVADAVRVETGSTAVRDIYIERMLIK